MNGLICRKTMDVSARLIFGFAFFFFLHDRSVHLIIVLGVDVGGTYPLLVVIMHDDFYRRVRAQFLLDARREKV